MKIENLKDVLTLAFYYVVNANYSEKCATVFKYIEIILKKYALKMLLVYFAVQYFHLTMSVMYAFYLEKIMAPTFYSSTPTETGSQLMPANVNKNSQHTTEKIESPLALTNLTSFPELKKCFLVHEIFNFPDSSMIC